MRTLRPAAKRYTISVYTKLSQESNTQDRQRRRDMVAFNRRPLQYNGYLQIQPQIPRRTGIQACLIIIAIVIIVIQRSHALPLPPLPPNISPPHP